MHRPAEPVRFTTAERAVHRTTGILVAILFATGFALYYEPIAVVISRRSLVALLHVIAGVLLGVPMFVGLAVSPDLRADVRRLNRMLPVDREWLRRHDRRRADLATGKFNGGQKLAAATFAGIGLVLLGTGILLVAPVWFDLSDRVREGATIMHDLFTFALLVLLVGHVYMAGRHRPTTPVADRR